MRKNILTAAAATAFAASLALAAPASAAVTFAPGTNTGFVGKGDVQLAFGWSNATLQSEAVKSPSTINFVKVEETITEHSWVCTKDNNNTQERSRTTETSTSTVVSSLARDNKKQITGFNLTGSTTTPVSSSTTDGPPLNSCPDKWALTPGATEELPSTGTLSVTHGVESVVIYTY